MIKDKNEFADMIEEVFEGGPVYSEVQNVCTFRKGQWLLERYIKKYLHETHGIIETKELKMKVKEVKSAADLFLEHLEKHDSE